MSGWTARLPHGALWLSLLALAGALSCQKIRSFDYWWQLRTGRLIAETGAVPSADPYSYTVAGSPWIDIHWLFQLSLHWVHSLGGHVGVGAAKLVLVLGLLALCAALGRRSGRTAVSGLALGAMLVIVGDRMMPRPELPSFVFLAAVLLVLDRDEQRPTRWLWSIPLLQLVWVNVHGLFALGLALCAIYLAGECVRPWVRPGDRLRPRRIRRLAAVTALAAAVSLLNPQGFTGAIYPIEQLGMIGPPEDRGLFGSMIAELLPPLDATGGPQPPLVWLSAGLAALTLGALIANWRAVPAAHLLLLVAFGYLGLSALRNLSLFAIVAASIAVRNLNQVLDRARARPRLQAAASLGLAVMLFAVAWDASQGRLFLRLNSFREPGFGLQEAMYPLGAVDWIERERPPGRLAHHMADGGLIIARLFPDYPVMIDGRLEVYGAERFESLQLVSEARLRELDAEYQFGAILVHYSLTAPEGLLWWLHLNSRWRLVFLDDVAALYVRVADDAKTTWPEVDLDGPELFEPLTGPPGPSDRFRRYARVNFLMSLRRWQRALVEWEAIRERYSDEKRGDLIHATLLLRTGSEAAGQAIVSRLLRERGDDPELLVQIADVRAGTGDIPGAEELYERVLALSPRFPYAALRRGRLAEAQGQRELAAQMYTRALASSESSDSVTMQAADHLRRLRGGSGR